MYATILLLEGEPGARRLIAEYLESAGHRVLRAESLAQALVLVQMAQPEPAPAGAGPLTAREREILHWVRVGKSNIEIGAILRISPLTVKNHVQKILRKLDVQNRTQAVGRALAQRILSL